MTMHTLGNTHQRTGLGKLWLYSAIRRNNQRLIGLGPTAVKLHKPEGLTRCFPALRQLLSQLMEEITGVMRHIRPWIDAALGVPMRPGKHG
jgi:hypothetical protein